MDVQGVVLPFDSEWRMYGAPKSDPSTSNPFHRCTWDIIYSFACMPPFTLDVSEKWISANMSTCNLQVLKLTITRMHSEYSCICFPYYYQSKDRRLFPMLLSIQGSKKKKKGHSKIDFRELDHDLQKWSQLGQKNDEAPCFPNPVVPSDLAKVENINHVFIVCIYFCDCWR